jgi:hypothetical protein
MSPSPVQAPDVRPQAGPPLRIWAARGGRAVLLAALAFWLFGAVLFLRADGTVDYTLPRRELPPVGQQNLASYRYGPRLRASSYFRDAQSHHHPMFLVDERGTPSLIEKWASAQRDRKPWLSISWREARTLERVRIQHAGLFESADLSARRYRLRCLSKEGVSGELLVEHNRANVAEHRLACSQVFGLRIDFLQKRAEEIVRVFEVEAWGH